MPQSSVSRTIFSSVFDERQPILGREMVLRHVRALGNTYYYYYKYIYIYIHTEIKGNVGIAIINHPPNHHVYGGIPPIKNGWFIVAIPT